MRPAVLFDALARAPERPAIEEADGRVVTCGELLALARRHAATGVVEVAAARSAELVARCLGAWLGGGAFVPVDPGDPRPRPPVASDPDLAYAIATSGSSGRPKVVRVGHAGIPALLHAQVDAFALGPGARALWLHAPLFDASISDWGTALAAGATLVIPTAQAVADLRGELAARAITHVDLPPALLAHVEPLPACVRVVVLGGEPCPPDRVRALARRARVVVVYGPTEATVCASLVVVDPARWERPLIGHPLPGITYRVIDGELYIGGDALALDYAGDPEETARRFVSVGGVRMYRTGDRVEPCPGGLAFAGRVDRQVKLRGRRVELDEIEAVAREVANAEVAVVVRDDRLVAFAEAPVDRPALRARLPAWMVPARVVVGPLPRTPTGKLDRASLATRALPSPALPSGDAHARAVALAWCRALGVDAVRPEDRFSACGGDSLARLVLQVALAAPGPIAGDPTFAELVASLRRAREELTVAVCEARGLAALAALAGDGASRAPAGDRWRAAPEAANEDGTNTGGGATGERECVANGIGGAADEGGRAAPGANEDGGAANEIGGAADGDGRAADAAPGAADEGGGAANQIGGAADGGGRAADAAPGAADEGGGAADEGGRAAPGAADEGGGAANQIGGAADGGGRAADAAPGAADEGGGAANQIGGAADGGGRAADAAPKTADEGGGAANEIGGAANQGGGAVDVRAGAAGAPGAAAVRSRGAARRAGAVLITGATGFLGRALVHAWRRRDPDRPIVALVRDPERATGLPADVERVRGDVARPWLGLEPAAWGALRDRTTSIVHAAAAMRLGGDWDDHVAANVHGTAEIARLAGGELAWHHVSTLSVFVATSRARGRHDERQAPDREAIVHGGYAQTKVAAEAIARAAGAAVFRLGLLVGDDARAHDQRAMTLRALATLGVAPAGCRALAFDETPVAFAADAIAALALRAEQLRIAPVHHIAAARATAFGEVVDRLGVPELPLPVWRERARARIDDPDVAMALAAFSGRRDLDLFLATGADFAIEDTAARLVELGVTQ